METLQLTMGMLDLMVRPAFCVKDGIIVGANQDAQRLLIETGTPVSALLPQDAEEYDHFQTGCLYLTIHVMGQSMAASVTKNAEFNIFILEHDADMVELNAMALAAQELREPLSNVMTVADRLFPVVSADANMQDHVSRINRGLFQMLRVISNMSDAPRYMQDTQSNMTVRNITAIFEEIFRKVTPMLEQAGVHLEFKNLQDQIYTLTDIEKLERAVYNILSNSLKFAPRDSTIQATVTQHHRKIYLSIHDSGTGVTPSIRANIHTRYQRQPGLEDSRFGIGLGMVLIRAAAAAHGGTVLMEYPEGGGVRITMTMRIDQSAASTLQSNLISVDYAGDRDHALIELSDSLPAKLYQSENIN